MIYAHIYEYMRNANYFAYRFIDDHRDEIEKIKRPSRYVVILKNGDEHHFLSRAVYDVWSMGRTYMIGDVLYRSGLRLRTSEKDEG